MISIVAGQQLPEGLGRPALVHIGWSMLGGRVNWGPSQGEPIDGMPLLMRRLSSPWDVIINQEAYCQEISCLVSSCMPCVHRKKEKLALFSLKPVEKPIISSFCMVWLSAWFHGVGVLFFLA